MREVRWLCHRRQVRRESTAEQMLFALNLLNEVHHCQWAIREPSSDSERCPQRCMFPREIVVPVWIAIAATWFSNLFREAFVKISLMTARSVPRRMLACCSMRLVPLDVVRRLRTHRAVPGNPSGRTSGGSRVLTFFGRHAGCIRRGLLRASATIASARALGSRGSRGFLRLLGRFGMLRSTRLGRKSQLAHSKESHRWPPTNIPSLTSATI